MEGLSATFVGDLGSLRLAVGPDASAPEPGPGWPGHELLMSIAFVKTLHPWKRLLL